MQLCSAEALLDGERKAHAETEEKLQKVVSALAAMNAISAHQTNHALGEGSWTGRFRVHPLTCGNDSNHTVLFPYFNGEKVVLRCPDCDYVQNHLPVVTRPGYSTDV